MSVLKPLVLAIAASSLLLAQPVLAQDREADEAETVGDIIDRILRNTEDSRKALTMRGREAARDAEEIIVDSELLSDMETLMQDFADKLDVEREDGEGTALLFDGEELLRFRRDLERDVQDRVTISGLGRNLSLERETVTKNGKTKTRIVIEMDGGEDVEIDLPSTRDEPEDELESDQE